MKLNLGAKVMVINVKENEFNDKEGKPVKSYKVAVEQDGEVATLPCTEDVFKNARPLEVNNLYVAYSETEFNGKIAKGLRVTGVAVAK